MTISQPPVERRLLPLTPLDRTGPHGSRSNMTCFFRCGNACDHPEPNRSENGHVQDEIAKAIARRSVLTGAAAGAGAMVLGLTAPATAATSTRPGTPAARAARAARANLARADFRPVAPNTRDAVVTAPGYTSDVIISWGDRVVPGAPRFDVRPQTPEAARQQFGYNCDYVGMLPLRGDHALLVVNHEYTDEDLMFPADTYTDAEIKAIAMSNHGMSVVRIRRGSAPGSWRQVKDLASCPQNRRVHIDSLFRLDGPAAGDERLRTVADPAGSWVRGTLNNCAGGMTPWGTVLSGEENFNQYFDASAGLDERYSAEYARYGITGKGRGWSEVDARFDLSLDPHEAHRFGWIVELDPMEPNVTPVKHTMLGRFKHEGANIVIASSGHAVAYMGDDERGDYLYKFVSRKKYKPKQTRAHRKHNKALLSEGTLYVARLTGDGSEDGRHDGTGEWIRLTSDTTSYVPGMSVADVLLFTRLAADKVSPTRMDRPEDVEPNLVNGRVYAALTNNSNRGKPELPVDEANPVASSMVRSSLGEPLTEAAGNRNGYVLEMIPSDDDHERTTFTWNLLLVCGDPAAAETYFGGFDKSKVSPISCPDNLTFDTDGNLWISTDGNVLGSNDGIFRVPVAGPERGRVLQFVTMPVGAEACGPLIADKNRSLFFAVQHPGEVDGSTFENQASTWPHTDDFPRPSVCVAYRDR
ncbi:PhoX family phosphatase [Nocardioides sp.]|uniref:PhoX family protein n=1 Tax=Nocardioides sp. TaxID=35761 RepID=UPI002B265826|nr:PhoX family phosphatase [Nocardioides sp.]